MEEIPGIKKYSNNIFLNSLNDLTRDAYKNDTKANFGDPKKLRLDSDIILKSNESFNDNNSKINSLHDEIMQLKHKLKDIYVKDEEIQKLKNEIEKNKNEEIMKDNKIRELLKFSEENKILRNENDKFKIEKMNYDSLKQENILLKTKLLELSKKSEEKDDTIQEINNDKIKIDTDKLKMILNNRLKTYHDRHIENLLIEYDLYGVNYIEKSKLENILLEAIHPK